MSERKKRRLKWWKTHLDEIEKQEHKEDVIIASKQRKRQRREQNSQTKKRKDSHSHNTVELPSADADPVGHSQDQTDKGKILGTKCRYTVFVGNLPYDVTAETLARHFNKGAGVSGIRLLTKKDSGMSRGCAFVDFTDSTSYMTALQFHHSLLGDRKINVEVTCGGGGQSKGRKKKLDFRKRKWRHKIKQRIDQRKKVNK